MPRATGLACGNARIGHGTRRVELQCHSSWPVAAVSLHTAAAAVSVLAAAAAIAAAATRDASASLSAATNMSLGSDFVGLAGLALQAELQGPPNRAFRDGRPRIRCICVLGAPPRLHRYKARMVDHPGSLVSPTGGKQVTGA